MAEVNDLEPASLIDMIDQLNVSFLTEHELAGIVGITFAHGSEKALKTFQRLWNVISVRAATIKRTSVNILGQFLQDPNIAEWLLNNVPYITTDIMKAVEHLRFFKTGNKRGVMDVLRLLDFTTCNLKDDLLALAVTLSDWNPNMIFHDLVKRSLKVHPMQPKLTVE
jgi:hypothetical protein